MSAHHRFTTSLGVAEWVGYLERLLAHHLPDGQRVSYELGPVVDEALQRAEQCFSHIHRKYFNVDGLVELDHLNSDHMAAFLYFIGNSAWRRTGDTVLPTKLFYLNKILNGVDLFFSVNLPEVFLLVHPVGTVVGNATYGNYLVIYQGCTIGSDAGMYPRFGEGTILYARSCVLGDCGVGDNVVFGANTFVLNADVPANSVIVGQHPALHRLESLESVRSRVFDPIPS